MVTLTESDAMLTRWRKTRDDRRAPRLPPVSARLVEFTVTSRDRSGRPGKTSRCRVLTTLLDHRRYPADQIAALYAERWEIELVYARAALMSGGLDAVERVVLPLHAVHPSGVRQPLPVRRLRRSIDSSTVALWARIAWGACDRAARSSSLFGRAEPLVMAGWHESTGRR